MSIHMIKVINSQQRNGSVNTLCLINQYFSMAPRASGQITILNGVFFVSKYFLGIEKQKKPQKFTLSPEILDLLQVHSSTQPPSISMAFDR